MVCADSAEVRSQGRLSISILNFLTEELNDLSLDCSCIEHGLRSSESLRDDNEYGLLEIYVSEGPTDIDRVDIGKELKLAFVGFKLCY